LRQAQALVGTEPSLPVPTKAGNRFGAPARAGLTRTGMLVRGIRKGTLRHDMKLAGRADLHQRNEGESSKDTCKEDREYWLSHEYGSFHWLKFDFRENEHKPVPGLDRADRRVRYRVASASESRRNTTDVLVKSWPTDMGGREGPSCPRKTGVGLRYFRAPPILGTLRSYRGNGDSGGNRGNSRKPGSKKIPEILRTKNKNTRKTQRNA